MNSMTSSLFVATYVGVVVSAVVPAIAQVEEAWVARYDNTEAGEDQPTAIAVDTDGNVYVTGTVDVVLGGGFGGGPRSGDYGTVKYDTDGNELWAARQDGAGGGYDRPVAITVDPHGNVYVTGVSDELCSIGGCWAGDIATVKYDAAGNESWAARWVGPGNWVDEPKALVVDADGNVYVTGMADADDGDGTSLADYVTIKYDAGGNELWVARYDGPDGGWDQPAALAVDSDGYVYVTGLSATIKYGPGGEEIWTMSPGGEDVLVDAEGNVHVRGVPVHSDGSGFATIEYSAEGDELEVTRYPPPGSDASWSARAFDSDGNVYLAGRALEEEGLQDFVTAKYDASGNKAWVARYDGPGGNEGPPVGLVVGGDGSVHVTGWSRGTVCTDFATVKYDAGGNELWVARYHATAGTSSIPAALTLDADGNVYVTGGTDNAYPSDSDFATVKYDSNGNEVWAAQHDGPKGGDDSPTALALDARGHVYVTGTATVKYDPDGGELWAVPAGERGTIGAAVSVDAQENVYVTGTSTVKYDPDGGELWAKDVRGVAIAVDADGDVYVTGTATMKYDPDGNELWAKDLGGVALALDNGGNVHVTGTSEDDYGTVKYDTDGNELWIARYDGPAGRFDQPAALAVDAVGNVHVTGRSQGPSSEDYATVKYDPDGNELWVALYDGPVGGRDHPVDLAIDAGGNVYVTGSSSSADGYDYATVKYDVEGNELWVARYDGPTGGWDHPIGLALDTLGEIYVTGKSGGAGGEDEDFATVKYDRRGKVLWVERYAAGFGSVVVDLAVDADRNVYVTGAARAALALPRTTDFVTIKYEQEPIVLPTFLRGDCNGDGVVDISDAISTLRSLFLGQGAFPCDDSCDSNDDSSVDISDAIATLGVLFLGQGTVPVPGMSECGVDPTVDELGCEHYSQCAS